MRGAAQAIIESTMSIVNSKKKQACYRMCLVFVFAVPLRCRAAVLFLVLRARPPAPERPRRAALPAFLLRQRGAKKKGPRFGKRGEMGPHI
jgi:hypothetical protein